MCTCHKIQAFNSKVLSLLLQGKEFSIPYPSYVFFFSEFDTNPGLSLTIISQDWFMLTLGLTQCAEKPVFLQTLFRF